MSEFIPVEYEVEASVLQHRGCMGCDDEFTCSDIAERVIEVLESPEEVAKFKMRVECHGFKRDENFNLLCLLLGSGAAYDTDDEKIASFEIGFKPQD